jgi:hypothetical protein
MSMEVKCKVCQASETTVRSDPSRCLGGPPVLEHSACDKLSHFKINQLTSDLAVVSGCGRVTLATLAAPLTRPPGTPTMSGPRFTGSSRDPGIGTNASGCVPVVP